MHHDKHSNIVVRQVPEKFRGRALNVSEESTRYWEFLADNEQEIASQIRKTTFHEEGVECANSQSCVNNGHTV